MITRRPDARPQPLVKSSELSDLGDMKKASSSKVSRSAATGKFVSGYKVLGVTRDGVEILKPKGRATHFTDKELRDAISRARDAKKAG